MIVEAVVGGLRRRRGGVMKRAIVILGTVALAAVSSVSAGSAAPAPRRAHVETIGRNGMRPNEILFSTLRFRPGHVSVRPGGQVTLSRADATNEPHTITIVRQGELPRNSDEVFNCPICNRVGERHFAGARPRLVVEDAQNRERGLDGRGDSMLILGDQSISRRVSAPAGSTLHFLCFIHPWMQGSISVR
jgi:plastocyanin